MKEAKRQAKIAEYRAILAAEGRYYDRMLGYLVLIAAATFVASVLFVLFN